ncbi:MAG: hypothetical protein HKO65_00525 [Gemmatimonadetes bacterium]|nr:cytochrome c family protein [Gemmatimonadota bacterium]NNM03557.1 hypothetical protein [Gemmatimonadota bacterium]
MCRWARPFPQLFLLSSLMAVTGFHSGDLRAQSIRQQWQASPHARSMDTPEEQERMNTAGCARCHTAQGYQHETLGGMESAAPYSDATGLTCTACHAEGEEGRRIGPIRAGAARDACRGCHDELVTNSPNSLSWCSQWGIFEGTGGAGEEGAGTVVSSHTQMEDGCIGCHMAPSFEGLDPTLVGGHTFRVKTKGDLPPTFNSEPCLSCHKIMTSEILDESQNQVRELLGDLGAMLPQRPDPENPGSTVPRFPADPTLTDLQARASHNYWLVEKDGSLGVHNPAYTRVLLEETMERLAGRDPFRYP